MRTVQKIVFILATAACAAMRAALKLNGIDPETGFYRSESETLALAFSACLIIGVGALVLLGFLERRTYACKAPCGRGSFRLLSLLAGICALWSAGRGLYTSVIATDYSGFHSAAATSAQLRAVLFAVPALLAGIFFLMCAAVKSNGKRPNGFISLTAMLWQVMVLLALFTQYTAVRSVSDQMCVIVMLVFCVLFLPGYGRYYTGIGVGHSGALINRYGLAFALLAFSTSAGIIAAEFSGKRVDVAMSGIDTAFYVVMALMAVLMYWSLRPAPELDRDDSVPEN